MGEIPEQKTLITQQHVKYMVAFILATLQRNWEKDSANTGTMPKTDRIKWIRSTHTQTPTRIWQRYWRLDIKREPTSKAWKRIMGIQIHMLIRYKSAIETQYRAETLPTWALWSVHWPHSVKYGSFT